MAEENIKLTETSFAPSPRSGRQGLWLAGRFLIWKKELRRSVILLGRTEKQVERGLRLLTWLIVGAGWAAFLAWIFLNIEAVKAAPLSLLRFWQKPDILITLFLLSAWFDLFLIYRRSQEKAALLKIEKDWLDKPEREEGKVKEYEVSSGYANEAMELVEDAYLLAVKLRQPEIEVIHLFRSMLKHKLIKNLLIRLSVDAKKLVGMVDRRLTKLPAKEREGRSRPSPALERVLISAFKDAAEARQTSVDPLNMIQFCLDEDEALAEILYDLEIDKTKIKNAVAWFRVNQKMIDRYHQYHRLAILKPGSGMNRSYTAIATPNLDHFSHDLTVQAKYGQLDFCVGRQSEIEDVMESFSGGHNGVILVGPNGVGKSAIVGGLAQLMVEERVPKFLKDKRLVELDVSRLVSGVDPAQAEERLLVAISEVRRSGNIVLYIDNIENLIGISAGSRESLDLSEVLAESLSRGQILCLASATSENYSRYIENKALGTALTSVAVKEPEVDAAIQILQSKVGFLEGRYDIYIVYSALEQAVIMSDRYLHDKALPLKAIDLLERAALLTAKAAKDNPQACFCGREQVALAIAELTGIPASKVTAKESEKLLNLESEIHQRLIDQQEAVSAVSASLRRARAQLKDSRRPIASFLFLGPTGVGKTELAKAVSEIYFGDEDYLVRLDMSEYQLQDSVKKMIGDADGTLGYLTEAVRQKPFSLVLLDEIEKAHPDILNLFLQLLDDGRLTDGQGRTISFSESIIIATSNIGAVFIQEQIKAKAELATIRQELIDNQLNQYLRPELINRFDGIIVFKPLSPEDVFEIATLMLKKIKKGLAEKGIDFKADKDGVAILAKAGYDPKFGARPMRRLLQERVENIIANQILAGELKRRDTVVINPDASLDVIKAPAL